MSSTKYGLRLGLFCAEIAKRAGLVADGVHPISAKLAMDHRYLVFAMPNRSTARQTLTRVLRAFDATKPSKAQNLLRDAFVVKLGDHPWVVREVLP